MKAITEFASFLLTRGNQIKATHTAEGKTPEEIQAAIGTSFKLEGDKLNYFTHALDVAGQNAENLKRVFVISLTEGEAVPQKATKVEELYYVPDFHVVAKPKAAPSKTDGKQDRPKRKGGDAPKTSPWGMSPEEKAAKAAKSLAAKAAAKV